MASGNDMKAAQETYNGFTKAMAWGAAICFVTALIVVALIA
ncbi:MAG TPA: aa3-type cytochrome c oxidase subunit IV [Novosphingobium sp.]|nr:aa3-type cytochrome c oxidase subunit IV [Novosphingobium sp.]